MDYCRISVSRREHTHDDFAWEASIPMVELNTPALDSGPTYFENESGRPQLYFASNRIGTNDIYMSELQEDDPWSAPVAIVELNSASDDARPSTRHDGKDFRRSAAALR